MSFFRGTVVPRTLLGVMGILLLFLVWGSVESIVAFGPRAESALVIIFALPLAVICLSVAAGRAPFRIRE